MKLFPPNDSLISEELGRCMSVQIDDVAFEEIDPLVKLLTLEGDSILF